MDSTQVLKLIKNGVHACSVRPNKSEAEHVIYYESALAYFIIIPSRESS